MRFVPLLILLFPAGILSLTGCNREGRANPAGSGPSPAAAIRVSAVHPETGGVERTVVRPGSLHAFEYADLYAKAAGYLENQSVDIGTSVKKRQILADLYAPELKASVEQASADVTKAKAQVMAMEAHLTAAQADVSEARQKVEQEQALVESAAATVALRRAQYKRIKSLAKQNAVEEELVDERLSAQSSAEAEERASRKAVAHARSEVEAALAKAASAQADVANAQASVQVAAAALDKAKVFAEYRNIRSPLDGVVTRRTYHNGDFIQDSTSRISQPLLRVARLDVMRAVVYVPDPDVPFTRPGKRADVRVDSLPDEVFHGTVSRIASAEDYTSRTMRTEVDLPNPKGVLADGMFGQITLYLGKTATGMSIPSACFIGPGKDGHRPVFVVRNGKAASVTVRVGLDDGVRAEVLSGLAPSDWVVSAHGPGLIEGSPVEVEPEHTK